MCLKDRLVSFNSTEDIFEKSIKYHSICLLNEKKKATRDNIEAVPIEEKYKQINDDYMSSIKRQLTSLGDSSVTLDINQLVSQYEALCRDADLSCPANSMRRYVRTIIEGDEEIMAQTDFYKYAPNKPSVLANKMIVAKLVCQKHFRENEEDTFDLLNEGAKEIRKELSSMKSWEFSGTFDDFEMPTKLSQTIKSIISDNKPLTDTKQKEIDVITCNIAQYIRSNFKSDC